MKKSSIYKYYIIMLKLDIWKISRKYVDTQFTQSWEEH